MPPIVLLGPQRFSPSLDLAVATVGVEGRLASVTAGWEEREQEDLELHEHLAERTINLMLWARGEDVLERDAELAEARRRHQQELAELQGFYRVRLGHAQAALRELHERGGDPHLLDAAKRDALAAIRKLDEMHLRATARLEAQFEKRLRLAERAAVAAHRASISRLIERVDALLVAGGHVGVLLDRLRLFGLAEHLATRPLFAWSAGAMAVSERVVLFHHTPPQGFGNTEVLAAGLGVARGVVVFPHAHRRLRLDDRRRTSLLARRFEPADCLALGDGGWILLDGAAHVRATGVRRLEADGDVVEVAA